MNHLQKASLFILFCIGTLHLFGQTTPTIEGVFETAPENAKVYLISTGGFVDSTRIANHKFTFTLAPDSTWDGYSLRCPSVSRSYSYPLFLNGYSHLYFFEDSPYEVPKISGDINAMEQGKFYQGLITNSRRAFLLSQKISMTKNSDCLIRLNAELKKAHSQTTEYCIDWIKEHNDSPLSVFVLVFYIGVGNRRTGDTLAEQYFNLLLPDAHKNNKLSAFVRQRFAFLNPAYADVVNGKQAFDFMVTDTAGHKRRLSDYFKNKYVLLDFWASWCGPCRANGPKLKSLYGKFKDRGFSILGESLDTDPRQWKTAIKADRMNWPQGSDLKGLDGEIASKYQILSIPLYILINPEGEVVLRNTGGDFDLFKSKLNELLK